MILKENKVALNISNIVTANQCANVILAAGGSAAVTSAAVEDTELLQFAASFTVNMGSIHTKEHVRLTIAMVKEALRLKLPVVFDPVGSGATSFRTKLARQIAAMGMTIIRGNASEVLSLLFDVRTKGVDSQHVHSRSNDYQAIAKKFSCVLLVTGPQDFVVSADKVVTIQGGDPKMTLKTGMGCVLTALVGALVTEHSPFAAAVLGSQVLKKAGTKLFHDKIASYSEVWNFIARYA